MGSFLEFGTLGGYFPGALLVTVLTAATPEATLLDWGWHIPFFIAAPLGLFELYIRLKLEETLAFQKHMQKKEALEHSKPRLSLLQMLGRYRAQMLKWHRVGTVIQCFQLHADLLYVELPHWHTGFE